MNRLLRLLALLGIGCVVSSSLVLADAEGEASLERVSRMSKVGFSWGPTFSPDGDEISFVSTMFEQAQLWTLPTGGGWPIQLTGHKDGVMAAVWSPMGNLIAFTVPPDGGGNGQIHLMEAKNGASHRRITFGGEETNWLGAWSPDGKRIYLSSNRRDPEAMDIYAYEVATGEIREVTQTDSMAEIVDVSPDGSQAVLWTSPERGLDIHYLLDLGTGEKKELLPQSGAGSIDGGFFSPDGKTIYLATDRDRDLMAFGRVRLAQDGSAGPFEVLRERDVPLNNFNIARNGSVAALVWNIGGRSELTLLRLPSLEEIPVPDLPSERILDFTVHPEGKLMVMALTGAAVPMDLWRLDFETGALKQLTHMPHPEVDLADLVRPELLTFPSHDGLEISGWLYRAKGADGPGPVAINIHGGPELQEAPIFQTLFQGLALQGISVFAPNIRGSAGFGKKFLALDDGPLRVDAIRDIKACADYLAKSGVADPERVGIFGMSYGGYATLAALTEFPETFAAGASVSGIVNFETFFANTEPWIAAVSKVEYGDPETQKELLRSLSPIHRLDKLQAPLVVVHGETDANVPVSEADQLVESLRERHVPVEYLRLAGEGHAIRMEENRTAFQEAIVHWFVRYLKNTPDGGGPERMTQQPRSQPPGSEQPATGDASL